MESALLRTRLARALEAHGDVELALLFGSRARGDAGPSSDIDVAVIGRSIDAIGLAIELTDAIGIPVDVVDLSGDPPLALLLAVLHDGIKINEGRPGAYGRFLARSLMVLETDLPAHRAMQRAFIRRVAARGLSGGR
ncbi:MAG: nucleotidyltransferase domain-containing protein [Deltaproteobacteria bacterium]|nr:MAG: nucleotidyltransferase domain-containing protein [Deltaproteobacteria bacterium]